jgi:alginate O-acetyltransferase complex protein AlgI
MLFVEFRFFIFAIIVFCVTWSLRRNSWRKLWLLVCSYVFYGAWNWKYLSLIWISTLVDYCVGLALDRTEEPRRRKYLLAASVCVNLGILGFFKYFNFFVDSAVELLNALGFNAHPTTLRFLLPVGISFYTFQTMSYSIDIYFKKMKCTRNLLDFALFVAFFPQLVAGPIVRAVQFMPQLKSIPSFKTIDFRPAFVLFLVGFFKKACISDNIAPYVDIYFANPQNFNAMSSWIAILLYSVQVYCDFSGYSDMAIATAAMLGYRLVKNFDFPYFSTTILEFWRRWHISLSFWLRDYLYIPLGGSRGGPLRALRNVMITMFLGGLWHGAAWNFVIWGFLHGVGMIINRLWSDWTKRWGGPKALRDAFGLIVTFWWFNITLLVFRSKDFPSTWVSLKGTLAFIDAGPQSLPPFLWLLFGLLTLVHYLSYRNWLSGVWERVPAPAFAVAYGIAFHICLTLMPTGYRPFIYFQF